MNSTKQKLPYSSICIAAASLVCSAAVSAADDSGWYLGAGIGRSNAQDSGSAGASIDGFLSTQGITSSTAVSSSDTAWKLYSGYRFNNYFATEGAYSRLGSFSASSSIFAPAAGSAAGTLDARNVYSLAAVGSYPVLDSFSLFGKLGLAYSKTDFNYAAPVSGIAVSQSASQTKPLVGIGLKYDFSRQIALRGEWERYLKVGNNTVTGGTDVDVLSLSLQYHF